VNKQKQKLYQNYVHTVGTCNNTIFLDKIFSKHLITNKHVLIDLSPLSKIQRQVTLCCKLLVLAIYPWICSLSHRCAPSILITTNICRIQKEEEVTTYWAQTSNWGIMYNTILNTVLGTDPWAVRPSRGDRRRWWSPLPRFTDSSLTWRTCHGGRRPLR